MTRLVWVTLMIFAVGSCGNITRKGGGEDAGVRDDAMPDAFVNPPPTPAREIVSGAGRLSGTTYTMDVQLGHPLSQGKSSGATYTIQGNAAVKP